MKKLTWGEMYDILCHDHSKNGVIVFKQHPSWKREFSELERSYEISGECNAFDNDKISTALWGDCLGCKDEEVRLDWYMKADDPKERWVVDYCYLLEK